LFVVSTSDIALQPFILVKSLYDLLTSLLTVEFLFLAGY
jgi:hypothetical protein